MAPENLGERPVRRFKGLPEHVVEIAHGLVIMHGKYESDHS
jgi:hypothetical protein